MQTTRYPLKKGFTLVEMLVVIAIIAILSSLLVTGVNKAKNKTYVIKTLANLRELHLANSQHALEYQGFYVPHRLNKAEDSDNPDTYWLDNDHFSVFLYKEDHNGWDDWPSFYKTGKSNANLIHSNPKSVRSKMSFAISLGGYTAHWNEGAYKVIQLSQYPRMIMFADSAQWMIHGGSVDNSPREYDESKGAGYGCMAFRYNGKAGMVTVSGNAAMVRYDDVLPQSQHPEIWPNVAPLSFNLYDL